MSGPTAGVRRPTGSPAPIPRPAVPAPNRATTSTSRRMPACAGSSRRTAQPINDTWYFHAGSDPRNASLTSIRRIIDWRYGMSTSAQVFADKAQLAHYENTCAQFEAFAAGGWDSRQDDHLLDAQQPLAVVLRQHLRLLPAARRAYYGASKGSATVGGVRFPLPPATTARPRSPSSTRARRPAAGCGCGCAPTTWLAGFA